MLKLEVINLQEVLAKIIDLPEDIADVAVTDVNTYMLNILRGYPPYKYVPYKKAYGGWKSEKQRRFVMAAIRDGRIKPGQPNRSQSYSRGWRAVGSGRNQYLQNATRYAAYLQGDDSQARMMGIIGWKKLTRVLEERAPRINEIIDAAIKKVFRKRKLI